MDTKENNKITFRLNSAFIICSFPGGKRDPTDTTILDTALREMGEEISIFQDQVEVLGEYLPMPNKDCTLRVHSFVGIIKEPIEDIGTIAYNPDEVQRVFTVSMQDLMDPQKKSMVRFRNSKYLYPIWNIEEENISIWGLTAFILNGTCSKWCCTLSRDSHYGELECLILTCLCVYVC